MNYKHALLSSLLSIPFMMSLAASTQAATPASAAEIEARFEAAIVAKKSETALRSKLIPAEIKQALLNDTRSEDRSYARDLIVRWKGYDARNIHAEFDDLVVQADDGRELVRVRSTDKAKGLFLINGREWAIPTAGSIEKSLRRHFESAKTGFHRSSKSDSIFAVMLSPQNAFAATPEGVLVEPTFLYVIRTPYGKQTVPLDQAAAQAPRHLAKTFLNDYLGVPVKVECQANAAVGVVIIDNDPIRFESQINGNTILTMNNGIGTKLLVRGQQSVSGTTVTVQNKSVVVPCLDSKCKRTDETVAHDTPLAWIVNGSPPSTIGNLISRAGAMSAMAALRPLGACCFYKSCRDSLATQNVKMVPGRGSHLTK